jgi:hypothetical protein
MGNATDADGGGLCCRCKADETEATELMNQRLGIRSKACLEKMDCGLNTTGKRAL